MGGIVIGCMNKVTLEGKLIRLEPLALAHVDSLAEVAFQPELWTWYFTPPITNRQELVALVETALKGEANGTMLPFAIVERATGRAIVSTRYLNVDLAHRRLEIGSTWIGADWQRTAVNSECKLLLLTHAFEQLKCVRVEFKTDSLNEKSRRAIERLGAREEGTLRSHFVTHTGRLRDTVYYSVLDSEWATVKAGLQARRS